VSDRWSPPGPGPTSATSPDSPTLNRFASWTGTAPLDASSGEQNRHRLSRAGNRRMNHMIHIAAISQIRLDTEGRAYYLRKRSTGKTKQPNPLARAREGTAGRLKNPARSTYPRISTLRISHFPDPRNRRYLRLSQPGRPPDEGHPRPPVDNKGEPK
jgi:hypothetical protein